MSIRVGRDRRSHAWGAPVEKRPRLTLLDEKWFPFRAKKEEHEFLIFTAGVNITKGFPFGTFMVKIGAFYSTGEGKLELGEYGIEYVKRLSDQ